MAVKKAVQSGNVEDAIEKVNDLNPEVRAFLFLVSPSCQMCFKIELKLDRYICIVILFRADIGHKSATLFPPPTAANDRTDPQWEG